MASVRITQDIRNYVRNKFDELFRARIAKKMLELQELGIGNACYEHYVSAKSRALIEQLNNDPDGVWIEPAVEFTIKMTYIDHNGKTREVTFAVPFKPPVPLPFRLTSRWDSRFFVLEQSMAAYEHAKKVLVEVDQLNEELDALKRTIIRDVLERCTTLRQVLEVWPTALDFMPDTVRAQHYAKAEKRSANATTEIHIDDSIKVALMKARMTQGT